MSLFGNIGKNRKGVMIPVSNPISQENKTMETFHGAEYTPAKDKERLTRQIYRIYDCMKDGEWRSLPEIAEITGDGEASISAQLRNLRKEGNGSHTVDKRRSGAKSGLWEYKLIPNTEGEHGQ